MHGGSTGEGRPAGGDEDPELYLRLISATEELLSRIPPGSGFDGVRNVARQRLAARLRSFQHEGGDSPGE
jgi:hypothetical protein